MSIPYRVPQSNPFTREPPMNLPSYSSETLKGFIAVEGLDGAGTSTQSRLLSRNLRAKGYRAQTSMEPTTGPIGILIKQIMRGRLRLSSDESVIERQLGYLFAADRHDHLYNDIDGILWQIRQGNLAITTRYFFSSYAYNARTPEAFSFIERLNRDFPLPEVIVHVHAPLEVSLQRLKERDVREFYEREEELRRVQQNYQRILEPLQDRVVTANSTGDRDEIAAQICEGVLKILGRGPRDEVLT